MKDEDLAVRFIAENRHGAQVREIPVDWDPARGPSKDRHPPMATYWHPAMEDVCSARAGCTLPVEVSDQ